MIRIKWAMAFGWKCLFVLASVSAQPIMDQVTHHYAFNGDTKIHYVSMGEVGPLVVMLHGFPDYWYTWRNQMQALQTAYRVVAMDLRGYNLSDAPQGVESYQMNHLMSDVEAVINDCAEDKAILVGHDWGGAIAWQMAINRPQFVDKLIVCNITHPTGSTTASIENLRRNGNQSYMDTFRTHTSETLSIDWMTGWINDEEASRLYRQAFERSDRNAMIHYYRANTQTKDQRATWLENPKIRKQPKIRAPVLMIFGTKDRYVDKKGLNNTWDWIDAELTLVNIPTAGHFVQHDAPQKVSSHIRSWLQLNP